MKINQIPLNQYRRYPEIQMQNRSAEFLQQMQTRRSVRSFSSEPVAEEIITNCIKTAGTAPSGANMQPWHFVVVQDPQIKHRIRIAAEREEQKFYNNRATGEWLRALAPLGTDEHKPFLEEAPCLIVVFALSYHLTENGEKVKHYYVRESVGIATGILITALHHAGLVCLTHTPSPMGFLNRILGRPGNERAFLLMVAGYPKEGCLVPDIAKKSIQEIATFI
jgi:iodotyrosine deiodinase